MTGIDLAQSTTTEAPRPTSSWRRWQNWAGYAAAAWSLLYGGLGLYWAGGGAGFPFGMANDPAADESLLEGATAATGAPVIVGLGFIGAAIALVMARTRATGIARWLLLAFAWVLAALLLVIVPDRRLLVAAAYAPLFVIGAPFGWPEVSFRDAIPWPVINQMILVVGGVLWTTTALAYVARTADATAQPGGRTGWSSPESARRWGRWAVAVAVVIPLIYAATRWAWALGIPLGISEEFLREGQAEGLWIAGAGLGMVAALGAILTLGLVQEWGEIFPRWVPGLAGKRVPPTLAIVPALIVAPFVTSAGLAYVRMFIKLGFPLEEWTTIGPELLWPFWGASLAAATLAYYLRRRDEIPNARVARPSSSHPNRK
jgi:hypothetical protein